MERIAAASPRFKAKILFEQFSDSKARKKS
jgi:hypothetical protein